MGSSVLFASFLTECPPLLSCLHTAGRYDLVCPMYTAWDLKKVGFVSIKRVRPTKEVMI